VLDRGQRSLLLQTLPSLAFHNSSCLNCFLLCFLCWFLSP
jgi:hypothetical protein